MLTTQQLFYSGTSGLDIGIPRSQYPHEFREKSRLHYYASLTNSLEINSIFYKLPKRSTVARWSESVPENFQFTFKLSKSVTHTRGLCFSQNDVDDFVSTIENVGQKKGCILIQFPPSLKFDMINRLHDLLEAMGEATQNTGWKLAVEFRDSSWYEREVYELLEEYEAAMVIQDLAKSAAPRLDNIWSDFIYLRFHGPDPRYGGDYSDEVLKSTAELIKGWIAEKKTVYAYFNNTAGAAFKNLQTLNGLVKGF